MPPQKGNEGAKMLPVLIIVTVLLLLFSLAFCLLQSRGTWPLFRFTFSGIEWAAALKMTVAISTFLVVGPALMMLNKYIMQALAFNFPLLLSSLGLTMSGIVARVLIGSGMLQAKAEAVELVTGWTWVRVCLPIAIAKALTLASGNAVYLHLGLGFIQMLKAFTPAIVVVIMRFLGMPAPTRAALWSVGLIVSGTLVEVHGELNATFVGVLLMFTSELMEATNMLMSQKLLQNRKLSIMEGLYVIAPSSSFCLLAMAAFLELPRLLQQEAYRIILENPWTFCLAGMLGFGVNFLSFLVIQATSALTLKILNIFRTIALVFVGCLFYGEAVSLQEIGGYIVALLGFVGYNFSQMAPEASDRLERSLTRCMSGQKRNYQSCSEEDDKAARDDS